MKTTKTATLTGLALLLFASACNSTKHVTGYQPTKKSYHKSPNVSEKSASFVVLHHTGCDFDEAYKLLATSYGKVSSHYLLDKDGTILQLVDEKKRASHAGLSRWFSMDSINNSSIGIEITNSGFEPFAEQQIDSLLVLLADIKKRYKMPARNFIGHMDIAPGRKVDPSAYFPWKRLAEEGYGIWYDEAEAERMSKDEASVAKLRDPKINFLLLGYGLLNIANTVEAFKLHFTKSDGSGTLSSYDKCVLQLLADKVIAEAELSNQ